MSPPLNCQEVQPWWTSIKKSAHDWKCLRHQALALGRLQGPRNQGRSGHGHTSDHSSTLRLHLWCRDISRIIQFSSQWLNWGLTRRRRYQTLEQSWKLYLTNFFVFKDSQWPHGLQLGTLDNHGAVLWALCQLHVQHYFFLHWAEAQEASLVHQHCSMSGWLHLDADWLISSVHVDNSVCHLEERKCNQVV